MKIIGAILHQPVGIPGVMAPNVNINATKLPGVQLKWDASMGLIWKIKAKAGDREGFFPCSTVSAIEVEKGSLWPAEEKKKAA